MLSINVSFLSLSYHICITDSWGTIPMARVNKPLHYLHHHLHLLFLDEDYYDFANVHSPRFQQTKTTTDDFGTQESLSTIVQSSYLLPFDLLDCIQMTMNIQRRINPLPSWTMLNVFIFLRLLFLALLAGKINNFHINLLIN